ncbi:MAG: 2-dehydropantoate 2-reductase [Butyrivibrio sp.]|uniref:LNS2 domain-containing protein n=1 Tax=Butyrivibrio sp. TaxID=28121 RepID=UPI0025CBFFBA|nr:2-dehydropantoate 2-reductase [Butyrivibrio sp.]MCR5771857.1 2-dehydropantoate 2-reductase [Butyrivibrio sp.]
MNIYIDFDDCLCETARALSNLAKELFGKEVPYDNIEFFDLQKSFGLTKEQYEKLMIDAHVPQTLMSYEETEGACSVVNEWLDKGHNVSIITGRPSSAYEPSRMWLDEHDLKRVNLFCLNKYGRDSFIKNSEFTLELEDYYKMKFDVAIEDSPAAFKFFNHLPDLKVNVFDRPWNRNAEFPNDNFTRCKDWNFIRSQVAELSAHLS